MKCRHAKDSELDGVCSLLAEEFYNDAIHKLIFSDHAVRMDGLRNLFRIYVNLATRHGGILLDENGAGALVYFCPEAMKMSDEDIASVDHQLRQGCGSNYPAAAVYTNGLDQHHPRTPPSLLYLSSCSTACSQRRNCGWRFIKCIKLNA